MSPHTISFPRLILPIAISLLVAVISPQNAFGENKNGCWAGKGGEAIRINAITISVSGPKNADMEDFLCQARIWSATGKLAVHVEDFSLRILPISGKDINGDGIPEVVIEGYSGGAHCCWTYSIISLRDPPVLVRTIYNQRDATFKDIRHNGRFVIETLDGSFDYFDDMSHAFAPFPSVYLLLQGRELKLINNEFWPRYAYEIQGAKSALSEDEVIAFRKGQPDAESLETRTHVLTVVLAYLYGGKKDEAWKALREYWPPKDFARMRKLIQETSSGGFLGDTTRPKYGILY